MEKIESLSFKKEYYPEVIKVANRLAELMDRNPHDAMRNFIVEKGQAEIDRLKAEKAGSV